MSDLQMVLPLEAAWEVEWLGAASLFFDQLGIILDGNSLLVLEESSMIWQVRRSIERFETVPIYSVPPGSLSPPSQLHYLRGRPECLKLLSDLAGEYAEPELCDHIYACHGDRMFLKWHDAFGNSILLSDFVQLRELNKFCELTGAELKSER